MPPGTSRALAIDDLLPRPLVCVPSALQWPALSVAVCDAAAGGGLARDAIERLFAEIEAQPIQRSH
jgi:hypothetical protein